jgi:hypothetical protein
MVLGYTKGTNLLEEQYVAFVFCREIDGRVSLWAATGAAEDTALSLENEWSADLNPAYDACPPFAEAVDDWFHDYGYPPPGATWQLIVQGATLNDVAEWVENNGGADLRLAGWRSLLRWLWRLLCRLFGGCNAIGEDPPPTPPDNDGDGVPNGEDPDVDGDGTPNGEDSDVDGDGVPNGQDGDVDGDGIPNGSDGDVDGGGVPNGQDSDVDGDGVPNGQDSDVDGDGVPNGQDGDVDGDGISNGQDGDVDGDGTPNGSDSDIDGDGLTNGQDDDMDGDGLSNGDDDDDDGDGIDDSDDDDDDADGEDDDGEGGGSGEPGDCTISVCLDAVLFLTGPITRWPDGAQLAPPPGGWHWTDSAGAVAPAVSGFGDYAPMLVGVWVQSASAACGAQTVAINAYLGPAKLAGATFELYPEACPYWIELTLPPIDRLPNADAVRTLSGPVEFEWCVAEGANGQPYCEVFGTAFPSQWYIVPSQDGLVPAAERYDLGLNKVVQYARGASSEASIARRVNAGIAAELCYNPGQYPDYHILNCYFWPGGVQCNAHADLLIYLCGTPGISASRLCTWGGSSPEWIDRYYPQGHLGDDWARVSLRLRAPRNDVAEENPHFYHHVVTEVAGITCDPSYGATWLPEGSSCYQAWTQQTGPSLPPHSSTVVWECEHPLGPPGSCP